MVACQSKNLNRAYKQVKSNKGSGGIDKMDVEQLLPYLRSHKEEIVESLLDGKYRPDPVRRVEQVLACRSDDRP